MGCTWNPYCATWSASGNTLASFNTQCWNGSKCSSSARSCFSCNDDPACLDNCCDVLKPEDIPNIDKIGIRISADTGKEYTVDNFCLKSITFGGENTPGTGGRGGGGGAGGKPGTGGAPGSVNYFIQHAVQGKYGVTKD
jgi:hypothetical protein